MKRIPSDSTGTAEAAAREALVCCHCEAIAQGRLSRSLGALFRELTGWNFHAAWRTALDWEHQFPLGRDGSCSLRGRPGCSEQVCRKSERKQLARLLRGGNTGRRFVCPNDVHNYWAPIRLQGQCLGVLLLRVPPNGARAAGDGDRGLPLARKHKVSRTDCRASDGEFARAARLLDLFALHLKEAVLVQVQGERLTALEQQIASFRERQKDDANDTSIPRADTPAFHGSDACENHQERIVHHIVRSVHERYNERLSLQDFSDQLHMNRAHLSALFSRLVGLPFRSYVKRLRLCEAERLLRDPAARISEVAFGVGYTDPNRFRLDFKARTGLSPSAWREVFG